MRCSTRHHPCRGGLLRRNSPAPTPAECAVFGTPASSRTLRVLRACAKRRGERGAAVLETFLSMLLIMLVLFGALQVFQLALTNMISDYSAFRGARSLSVGFDEDWAIIESKVKSAPASGHIILPGNNKALGSIPLSSEQNVLTSYMEQVDEYKDLSYTNWNGRRAQFHTDYRCPSYGQPVEGECSICYPQKARVPTVTAGDPYQGASQMTHFNFHFNNYPLAVPFYRLLTGQRSVNISSESELANYSYKFLTGK